VRPTTTATTTAATTTSSVQLRSACHLHTSRFEGEAIPDPCEPASTTASPKRVMLTDTSTHRRQGLPATVRTEGNISHQQGRVVSGRKRHVHHG